MLSRPRVSYLQMPCCTQFLCHRPLRRCLRADCSRAPLPVGSRMAVREAQEGRLGSIGPSPLRQTISGDIAPSGCAHPGRQSLSVSCGCHRACDREQSGCRIPAHYSSSCRGRSYASSRGGVARGVPSDVREGPTGLGSTPGQASRERRGCRVSRIRAAPRQRYHRPAAGPQSSASGPSVPNLDPDPGWFCSASTATTGRRRTRSSPERTRRVSIPLLGDLRLQKGFLFGGVVSGGLDARARIRTTCARRQSGDDRRPGSQFRSASAAGFGLAVNNRYIRIAKNNRNVSDLVFEQQVVSTAYTVARLYWDLVAIRSDVSCTAASLSISLNACCARTCSRSRPGRSLRSR